jgi:hypothetical protein
MMNRFSNIFTGKSTALIVASTVLLVASVAQAKDHKPKPDNQAQVVAHISFSGLAVMDMAIQKKPNDQYYLYVQHARDQGISVIDIGKPAQAKVIGLMSWPDSAMAGSMNLTGNMALIAESEVLSTPRSSPKNDLVLWDMSNPTSPRVVQKFSGVVKWLEDERSFIYVLNGDGLWVISQPTDLQQQANDSYNGG